jgi:hypothetical protein
MLYSCIPCNYECTLKTNYERHNASKRHLKIVAGESTTKEYSCDKCEYTTKNAGNFYKHTKNHEGKRSNKFHCLACELDFMDTTHLKAHLLTDSHKDNVREKYPETIDQSKIAMKRLDLSKRDEYIQQLKGEKVDLETINKLCSKKQLKPVKHTTICNESEDESEDEPIKVQPIDKNKKNIIVIGQLINKCEFITESQAKRYIESYNELNKQGSNLMLYKQIKLSDNTKNYEII